MFISSVLGLAPTAKQKDKDYVEFVYKKIEEFGLKEKVIFPNYFYPNGDVPYIFSAMMLLFSHIMKRIDLLLLHSILQLELENIHCIKNP
ncbi:MAG: hypothetical protein QMD82_06410 [bacterium]|nr:hypothetical protein [bacterium]